MVVVLLEQCSPEMGENTPRHKHALVPELLSVIAPDSAVIPRLCRKSSPDLLRCIFLINCRGLHGTYKGRESRKIGHVPAELWLNFLHRKLPTKRFAVGFKLQGLCLCASENDDASIRLSLKKKGGRVDGRITTGGLVTEKSPPSRVRQNQACISRGHLKAVARRNLYERLCIQRARRVSGRFECNGAARLAFRHKQHHNNRQNDLGYRLHFPTSNSGGLGGRRIRKTTLRSFDPLAPHPLPQDLGN